ncbi:MAG: hypothetical protein JW846_05750 [Dehalococcoidia bacterium]|nr:hypothetical protein [Dehalococcoidia bacterium]
MARTFSATNGFVKRLLTVALVSLLVATGCDAPRATPGTLTDVEKEYADALALTFQSALSVPMDVDEIVDQNIDHTLSGESNSSNMVRVLEDANIVLTALARELREPTPYTMDSLAESNESAAAVFEGAYTSCIDVVIKETTGAWGSNALSDLVGVDPGTSVAAKARILACVGSEGDKVKKAVEAGLGALRAKEEEIKSGRAKDAPDDSSCFIATAAYGSDSAVQLDVLRQFRDDVLLQSEAGRDYVGFYYAASPSLADYIAEREWLRTLVRELLVDPAVAACQFSERFWAKSQAGE